MVKTGKTGTVKKFVDGMGSSRFYIYGKDSPQPIHQPGLAFGFFINPFYGFFSKRLIGFRRRRKRDRQKIVPTPKERCYLIFVPRLIVS
jgi:hypothetical protein